MRRQVSGMSRSNRLANAATIGNGSVYSLFVARIMMNSMRDHRWQNADHTHKRKSKSDKTKHDQGER